MSIITKYGNAYINKGHYKISSGKNIGKPLHRLIFADFYGLNDIDDFFGEHMEIHHNDGNPLNNEIWNLIPLTSAEHMKVHKKGIPQSENHKRNRSLFDNKIGVYRVSKQKDNRLRQGFAWVYMYFQDVGGKHKRISSVYLDKLMVKVKKAGLPWIIIDEEKFLKTCKKYGYNPNKLIGD